MSNQGETLFAAVGELANVTAAAVKTLESSLAIKTVADLAQSPQLTFAAEIREAAADPRHMLRRFGIPDGRVAKASQDKSVEELADAPLRALEGIAPQAERALATALGVKTLKELALWPPFLRAREILAEAVRTGVVSGRPSVCRVSGLVVRSDGSSVVGAEVKIQRQGIRKATPLGTLDTVKTNTNGGYVFEYERPAAPIDLRVELLPDQLHGIGVTKPRVITHASEDERADFVVGDEAFRGRSTFESFERAVSQALAEEGTKAPEIANFDDEALAQLALRSGIDPGTLVLLRQSYALAKQTALPAAVFFGMGQEKIPLGLPALLAQDPDRRRAAVRAAFAENHIPAGMEKDTARVLTALDDLAVADALKMPATPDKTTLGALLTSARLAPAKQNTLAATYVKHTGTNEEFWKKIRTDGILTDAEADLVQFTLQLGAVTLNHGPMVAALKARGVSELRGLATLGKADWIDLIKGSVGGQPVGLPADLIAAGLSADDYAEMIFRVVEDALPTAMVQHRIDNFPNSAGLKRFFERNAEFDLRTAPVRTYLEAHPTALDFAGNDEERKGITKVLKGLERAYRIAPPGARVDTMEALLKDGIDSAQKVRVLGRAAFVRRFEETLGRERAEKVWVRANNASALATTVLARHSVLFDRTPIHVLPKRIEKLASLPSYEEMFGSLDFCSCEHCRSVFGPAAYLVDVLNWLDNRQARQSGKTALDVLFDDRRGDIGTIELCCGNTNTPLPYIDLVNEVLELTVAPVSPSPAYQTTGQPAALRAHPEHLHRGAYEVLAGARASSPDGKDAVYPFNLPFNLWIEDARTYLGQLGVTRYRLMEAFQGEDSARTDQGVAAETLGLSRLEWEIVAGRPLNPSRSVAALWGLPGDSGFTGRLKQVSRLLGQATLPVAENGMEFEELADLLRTDFIQAPATVGVWFNGQACDTTKAELVGLTEASLDRMHRFIRLRRRLGWPASDLDRAIKVLGGGTLDQLCLIKISHVQRLATQLHLPIGALLDWWGPLDTRRWAIRLQRGTPLGAPSGVDGFGLVFNNQLALRPEEGEHASPYDRMFQTASTGAEPSLAFGVKANGDALVGEGGNLAEHLPTIAGALGVTAEDLAELVPLLPNGNLSLSNLSALARHVSLARALDLRIRDLVAMLALTGISPFEVSHTENALALLDEVRAARESGFSVPELDYLLRHRDTKPATLEPDDVEVSVLFFEIGEALRKVEVDHPLPIESAAVEDLRGRLQTELEVVLATDDVGQALAIVDVEAGEAPPPGAETFIQAKLEGIFDPADARTKLVDQADPDYKSDRRDRLVYALSLLVTHLRRVAEASLVIDKMASAVGIDPALAAPLLRDHLVQPDASGRRLLAVFSDDAVRVHQTTEEGSDEPVLPGAADLPDQFAGYKRLYKAALVLNRLRIRKEELPWVLEHGPARGTLDFQQLPVAPGGPGAPYAGWERLRDAIALRNRFSPKALVDLFAAAAAAETQGTPGAIGAAHEALLTELERRSRWQMADIEFFVGTPARGVSNPAVAGALGFTYPADWKDERPLKRLAEVMAVVRRVGLPAATLWPWREIPLPANGTPGAQTDAVDKQAAQAEEIKQAVRARHEEARWYEVAPTLRNRLRERQREVLVGWLVGNDPRFADANALFEHLLLDVEMSACQLTSRIKQAISSAQLFVQRLLMGLEVDGDGAPLVDLSKDEADEWEWMKSYRVWEANRKVFLYPENWIEPELRDDKTPFFRELEDELLQSEVTAESAERALRGYLEKLNEVARLEIVGLLQQTDDGRNVLHVLGRTRGTPPNYYYRQRIGGSFWTPWEKVPVDIEGDHLVPVVFNRRLHIFWPLITESAIEETSQRIPPPSPAPEPKRYYQIRLAWSHRSGKKWSPKKIARPFIGQDVVDSITDDIKKTPYSTPSDFFIRAFEDAQGDLIIEPVRRVRSTAQARALMLKPKAGVPGSGDLPLEPPDLGGVLDPVIPLPPRHFETYMALPRFRISGCDEAVTIERPGAAPSVRTPRGMETANQAFVRTDGAGALVLPARNPVTSVLYDEAVLDKASSPFEIIPLRLDGFESNGPFFYQDRRRTFFVNPSTRQPWFWKPPDWVVAANLPLDIPRILPELGPRPKPAVSDLGIFDSTAVVRLPDVMVVVAPMAPPAPPPLGPGLAAFGFETLDETFGSPVAFVGGEPPLRVSRALTLGVNARIVDVNGRELAAIRTGMAPAAGRDLGGIVVNRTLVMPAPAFDGVALGPSFKPWVGTRYRFDSFYHPYLCLILRTLNRFGLAGLFDPAPDGPESIRRQEKEDEFFAGEYGPRAVVIQAPKDSFDFSYGGSYACYNWELFFHVPFLIACHLSKNHRFAEAQGWFHYMFDPTETDGEAPQRFWKVKPLFNLFLDENAGAGPIHELLLLLQYNGSEPEKLRQRDEIMEQVAQWRANPFNPHALARLRLGAYARAVVMKYIDNLVEWGDQLFRRDTLETINEATQLYVLAARILGRRPRRVEVEPTPPKTFKELRGSLDKFSNALVEEVEGLLPEITDAEADVYVDDVAVMGPSLVFCVPPNEKLFTDYWDRVADRLFKIRHCMNIEGIVRELPLFEPPIDPALLVRAKALGVDLASALSDLNAPLPFYRYQVLAQKATELCADVRGLGQALLSALEKRDAEELALLRAGHELKLQNALLDIREKQIQETNEVREGLQRTKEGVEARLSYYRSRTYMNAAEAAQFGLSGIAGILDAFAQGIQAVGSILAYVPNAEAGGSGFGGSPVVTFTFGGMQFSLSAEAASASLRINAAIADRLAQLSGLIGSYDRRQDEWGLQGDTAAKDIESIDRQLAAAQIRVAIAEKELENLTLQLEQSKEAEEFLRNKYTNDQLYHWMVGQLSSIYFQSYRLAYDVAKRAERAWQFELAMPGKGFIQFGYWDSLKKGLLAGDRLHHDLKRMEVAYLDENRREYEITKHVALSQLDPLALAQLRQTGSSRLDIPEAVFDLDYPGHYLRRLKSVGITIPCVSGPYTGVNCTLTLEKSCVRHAITLNGGYARDPVNPDARFTDSFDGIESIVTSHGQNDAGLFDTNLRDERYLPFEGAGAISTWRVELPGEFRSFDYDTISDLILHLRYTARDGGAPLKQAADEALRDAVNAFGRTEGQGLARLLSLRHDFPSEWHRFLNPPATSTVGNTLTVALSKQRFPFLFRDHTVKILAILVLAKVNPGFAGTHNESTIKLTLSAGDTAPTPANHQPSDVLSLTPWNGFLRAEKAFNLPPGNWTMNMWLDGGDRLNPDALAEVLLVCGYIVA